MSQWSASQQFKVDKISFLSSCTIHIFLESKHLSILKQIILTLKFFSILN